MSGLADDALVRRIVGAACTAPSIHNTQPWRFRLAGAELIELHSDLDRTLWVADPRARALYLSCGAALFNLRLAVCNSGYRPLVWSLPESAADPTLVASVQLVAGRPVSVVERQMFEAIKDRRSNRQPFSNQRIPDHVRASLEQQASFECASLRMLGSVEAEVVLDQAADADITLAADRYHRAELATWIGQRPDSRVGVPCTAIGPRPEPLPGPIRDFGAEPAGREAAVFESQPQLGVLSTARDRTEDWLRAGQALQRVLLTATRFGLATSLLYQPMELQDMQGGMQDWWPLPEYPQIIIRFGYGPPAPRSPRLSLAEVLDSEGEIAPT